jgi:hypothetical protein
MAKDTKAADKNKVEQIRPKVEATEQPELGVESASTLDLISRSSGDPVENKGGPLADSNLQTAQRHQLANQIGRRHGNQYLQRLITNGSEKSGASNRNLPANGNGSSSGRVKVNSTLSRRAAAVSDNQGEYLEETSEAAGAGNPTFSASDSPPDEGNFHNTNGKGTIQREDEGDEEGPTEAEKAAALAAAKAAEATAGQASSQAKSEVTKSQAKKTAEKETGKQAKQKESQAKAAAKAKAGGKKKPSRGVNGKEKAAPKGKGAGGGPGGGAAPLKSEQQEAPKSPEEDPQFQAVKGKIKGVGGQEKRHDPAEKKSQEAQEAAEAPPAEVESKAQANQVGEMEQAETPAFDAAAFKAQLMQKIRAAAPKSAQEADNFKQSGKLGGIKGEMKGKVEKEQASSKGPLEEKSKKPPDPGGIEPKPVKPLTPAQPGAPPPKIGAQAAAPKKKSVSEVEAPVKKKTQSVDQEMAEAEVSDEQLAQSNEPEFQGALDSKKEAKDHAQQAPQEVRQAEQSQIEGAEGEAAAMAQERTQAMHGDRAQVLSQVEGGQGEAKSEDESARQKVASDIQKIYDKTKTKVEQILGGLDGEVESTFDEGSAAAKQAFEDFVDSKMNAYKERRYGGWLGWAKWAKDKLLGMPSEVNAFYAEGRELFLNKMDAVIDSVVAIIGTALTEAKAEIAQGKQEIQDYVNQLPEDLQKVGQQAADNIQEKFAELEQSVEDKQGELIDSLASKYQETLKAVDARIDELKAANQGLVDKAINAVKGVIKTILKLKKMLNQVLSKVASVVGKIIKDPIGFLGNLVKGLRQGFDNFAGNIKKHLISGLVGWLTGSLGSVGIQLPEDIFSLKGIFSLVMQVLGLTWDYIRSKAVKLLGEPMVKALETGFEIFQILITEGPGGLWEYVKDQFSNLKEMVIEEIQNIVITEVIKAGVKWIVSMLNPAGAFIKAAMAIYDIVMFFIERGSQILELVNSVVDSVAAIASGAISSAANLVESALAKALPLVIDLLARLLGLGGLAKKIKNVIMKVRKKIDKVIDKVIIKAKKAGKKLLGKIRGGKEKKVSADEVKKEKKPDENGPEVKAGLGDLFKVESQRSGEDQAVTKEEAEQVAASVKKKHSVFKKINVVESDDSWDYDYTIQQKKAKGKKPRADRKVKIKLKRPGKFWKKTREDLKEDFPGEHKKTHKRPLVKRGMARRHIISSKEVIDHYEDTLNGKTLAEAKKLLEATGQVTVGKPLSNKAIEKAAKELLRKFFNETKNLWVGDSAENSSIQEGRDYPEDMSAAQKGAHVTAIKRKYFIKK